VITPPPCFPYMYVHGAEIGLAVNVHSRSAGHHAVALLQEAQCARAVLHAFDGKAHYAEVGRSNWGEEALAESLLIGNVAQSNAAPRAPQHTYIHTYIHTNIKGSSGGGLLPLGATLCSAIATHAKVDQASPTGAVASGDRLARIGAWLAEWRDWGQCAGLISVLQQSMCVLRWILIVPSSDRQTDRLINEIRQHTTHAQSAEKGQINVPENLTVSCAVIAETKGLTMQEVARATRQNALRLFFNRDLLGGEGDVG
jgi:hypothetical protein